MPRRVFLLSPARCDGERAEMMLSPRASFPLARRLREPEGAPLGEVMSFLSGLYFRGKLTYAEAFARPPAGGAGVLVITTNAGLQPPSLPLTADALRRAATVDIDARNPRYRRPLELSAAALAERLRPRDEVVLLGSIASAKYVDVLTAIFGTRLVFPLDFVGRGDMSRGGLLLRCVLARRELTYAPVLGAVRRGARPPRLEPLRRTAATPIDPSVR
ncbi:MAG TPA: hypothetical protein VGR82_08140 [Methylomirabilota bacterium]|jgi:hypothetical protein|nr:hypothetical protein [Methylomirabilota bacterium]